MTDEELSGIRTGFAIGSDIWPGISKLVEELGEVAQVAGKLIATGGETGHWDGTDLRTRLEDELADLEAAVVFVISQNQLDADRIAERREAKLRLFNDWHHEQGSWATSPVRDLWMQRQPLEDLVRTEERFIFGTDCRSCSAIMSSCLIGP